MLESSSIVRQFAEVKPEHLFVQIPEQVKLFHAYVGSLESALEQAPEVFQSIGVNLPVNVFFGMVNDLVLESLFPESLIGHKRIGVDRAPCFDVSANLSLQGVLFAIAHDRAANFSAAFKNPDDGHFVFCASLSNPALALIGVHEASGPADESFVYFDLAPASAKFQNRAILHRKPDAMKHEPSRLLSDAKSAGYFVGTDSILAVCHHPHCDEPLVERKGGILKDSSYLTGELFPGVFCFALPQAPSRDEMNLFAPTSGALNAVRPAALNHECEAVVGIGKMHDGLLKCFRLFHGVPHKTNRSRNAKSFRIPTYKKHGGWGCYG